MMSFRETMSSILDELGLSLDVDELARERRFMPILKRVRTALHTRPLSAVDGRTVPSMGAVVRSTYDPRTNELFGSVVTVDTDGKGDKMQVFVRARGVCPLPIHQIMITGIDDHAMLPGDKRAMLQKAAQTMSDKLSDKMHSMAGVKGGCVRVT
jgi:hypothetical protein